MVLILLIYTHTAARYRQRERPHTHMAPVAVQGTKDFCFGPVGWGTFIGEHVTVFLYILYSDELCSNGRRFG